MQERQERITCKQVDWLRIADSVKEALETKLVKMLKTEPCGGEWYDFVRALREALWLEHNAMCFDLTAEDNQQPRWKQE